MVNSEINSTSIGLVYFMIMFIGYVHKKSGFLNAEFFLCHLEGCEILNNSSQSQVKIGPGKHQVETENHYKVSEKLQEPIEVADGLELGKNRGMTNIRKRNLKKKVHKVILIGDSHARGCAEKISNYLRNSYEVTGYVNPVTSLEVITHSAMKEIDCMTPKYVVIVCGGSNNISKNQSIKGLKQVTQFVQNKGNTNVIIMNAPHRFDLEESSCGNKEIEIFNRKPKRIMKRYNHTEVTDMSVNRDHYTKHGLHMRKRMACKENSRYHQQIIRRSEARSHHSRMERKLGEEKPTRNHTVQGK